MFDLKRWSKKSPLAAWISIITTAVLAINGAINGILDIYSKFSDLNNPDKLLAVIERANFQGRNYDEVHVSFRNPMDKAESVNNFYLMCEAYVGHSYALHAVNNSPQDYSLIKGLEHTPINISRNSSKIVKMAFIKTNNVPSLNKRCKSITPVWGNNSFETERGSSVKLAKNSVYFTRVEYDSKN